MTGKNDPKHSAESAGKGGRTAVTPGSTTIKPDPETQVKNPQERDLAKEPLRTPATDGKKRG